MGEASTKDKKSRADFLSTFGFIVEYVLRRRKLVERKRRRGGDMHEIIIKGRMGKGELMSVLGGQVDGSSLVESAFLHLIEYRVYRVDL